MKKFIFALALAVGIVGFGSAVYAAYTTETNQVYNDPDVGAEITITNSSDPTIDTIKNWTRYTSTGGVDVHSYANLYKLVSGSWVLVGSLDDQFMPADEGSLFYFNVTENGNGGQPNTWRTQVKLYDLWGGGALLLNEYSNTFQY